LAELGVCKGDPVAALMGNVTEYVELFFACAKLGALFTLANYGYAEGELHSVLSRCGARVLVMVAAVGRYDFRAWVPRLKAGIPSLQHVIVVDAGKGHVAGQLGYESIVAQGASSRLLLPARHEVNPDDILNLQFTSGSTGNPKAAALTHQNIHQAGVQIGATMGLQWSDKICLPVPLFHSFGFIIGLATVACWGASIVLPSELFDVEATIQSVQLNRCTGIYGVTTMFVAEMEHPRFSRYDMSSLQFALIAGSAAPESLVRRIWSRFGISTTYSNWGLTESASICTMTRRNDSLEKRVHTSGTLFPGFSAKIVDPVTNRVLPWGVKGEIVLRGPGIQKGYYKDEIKTNEAHKLSPEDQLIWFHTGDEGLLDPDGYFCITGRIKDMIIRGGENISPLEIEERLIAHPAVAQVAVIGVPDDRYGEQIAAFVEVSASSSVKPSDEELRKWVRQKLAPFKQPKYFWWLGSRPEFRVWPKTGSGKLRKPDLRVIASRLIEAESKRSLSRPKL
jgi:long-chain acyl-CoA synthetase